MWFIANGRNSIALAGAHTHTHTMCHAIVSFDFIRIMLCILWLEQVPWNVQNDSFEAKWDKLFPCSADYADGEQSLIDSSFWANNVCLANCNVMMSKSKTKKKKKLKKFIPILIRRTFFPVQSKFLRQKCQINIHRYLILFGLFSRD